MTKQSDFFQYSLNSENSKINTENEDEFSAAFKKSFHYEEKNVYEKENDAHLFQTKESSTEKEKEEDIKIIKSIFKTEIKSEKKLLGKKKSLTRKDNILNKNQVHAINSINNVVNSILDFYNHRENERFLNINAEIKKMINKKEIKELKGKKLKDILTSDISGKYKLYTKNYNKRLYYSLEEKAKTDQKYEVIINFLNENFLTFFQNVYHKNERTINLHNYGLDASVPLSSKVELCEDRIKTFADEEYTINYEKCINEYYYDSKLKFYIWKRK